MTPGTDTRKNTGTIKRCYNILIILYLHRAKQERRFLSKFTFENKYSIFSLLYQEMVNLSTGIGYGVIVNKAM